MKSVAIIGSRRINEGQFKYLVRVAQAFVRRGWTIRTGGAVGADYAAMTGADRKHLHVFLPWASYNKELHVPGRYTIYNPSIHTDWTQSVYKYHPAPQRLSRGAFALQARNYGIIIHGQPVDAVVAMPMSNTDSGGTGQGIRIAREHGITLFVVCNKEDRIALTDFIHSIPKISIPKIR